MADTLVEGSVIGALDNIGLFGPYWSDISTGVIVFVDGPAGISFARTVDKGATWVTTQIEAGSLEQFACWWDKATPGDSGNLVHVAWLDSVASDASYVTINVATGVLGTIQTIDSTLTVDSSSSLNRIAITKAVGGNLIAALSTQTEIEAYRSVDAGVNWTDRADFFEVATQEDWLQLYPADTGDNQDVFGVFWDRSANELSVKMYDDSANTVTETSIATSMDADTKHQNFGGAVRNSDKHLLLAAHSNDDTTTDDLLTWDITVDSIASPTVTVKANIFTNQDESAQVGIIINQQNDDVYIAHLKGVVWEATVDVVFHKSVNGMTSWGAETPYSEAAADDIRMVHGGVTVGDDGGRIQFSFYNDDLTDIFVNEVNDIEIVSVVGLSIPVAMHSYRQHRQVGA